MPFHQSIMLAQSQLPWMNDNEVNGHKFCCQRRRLLVVRRAAKTKPYSLRLRPSTDLAVSAVSDDRMTKFSRSIYVLPPKLFVMAAGDTKIAPAPASCESSAALSVCALICNLPPSPPLSPPPNNNPRSCGFRSRRIFKTSSLPPIDLRQKIALKGKQYRFGCNESQ